MKFELNGRPLAALIAVVATIAFLMTPAVGQTPTAEQLKLFQSLPKEQRDAILQQMGTNAGSTTAAGARAGGAGNQIVVQQPANVDASTTGEAGESGPRVERRIKGGETLLIEFALPAEASTQTITEVTPDGRQVTRSQTTSSGLAFRSTEDQKRLTELRDRLLRRNPYTLSPQGVLELPGLDRVALAGLTATEAQARLALDPSLRDFSIAVSVLRLTPMGVDALKPFGYELFRGAATAFVPGTDIPAPDDYRLGPGDVMDVQLYGQQSRTVSLPVSRDGVVSFPDLGPISVGGMNFGSARNLIEGRVRQQMIGTQARVTLSELRTTRVLVLGDAERPGSYVISSLGTVTSALFASGGVKPIGSLRRIEVKRGGQLVRRLDLYDVLLKGDTSNDVRLETGDAVFVPPVGPTVSIDGEVKRPAIYEVAADGTVAEVVALAGGLTPAADQGRVVLERYGAGGDRVVTMLDLAAADAKRIRLQAGDVLRVMPVRQVTANGITLQGHVQRPGTYAYREGMRLTDLVSSVDDLKSRADVGYVLVRREDPVSRRVSVVSTDLSAAIAARGSRSDIPLAPRDVVNVFDLTSPRDAVIDPLLEELARQGNPNKATAVVTIGGRVNAPGRYPLEPGMKVSDLLRAGGGLQDAAYAQAAELARYNIVADGSRRRAELEEVSIAGIIAGDGNSDVELRPYDVLSIKETPEWGRVEQVELVGEVRFPGKYQIRRGETLRSVLERAGGLSPLAFAEGAALTRIDLQHREREQLDRLANRLQSDIAVLSLQASQTNPASVQAISAGQSLLEQLRQTRPVGRLVIDLNKVLDPRTNGEGDVVLKQGDRLVVPRLAQEVSVLGEVQNPTSHLFRSGTSRDDYVALSGGLTSRADRKRMYVVRADGSVVANSSRWFGRGDVDVHAGDTVVVPVDAEKMRPLPLWTAVTQIVYNLAIAAAAVNSF